MKVTIERIRKQGRFKLKLWRSIADWTTWFYLVIPTGLFLSFLYKETLLKNSFGLLVHLPLGVLVFGVITILSMGSIRTFTERADKLFFVQSRNYRRLKAGALVYSLSIKATMAAFIISLMMPIWIHLYGLNSWQPFQLIVVVLISFVVNTLLSFKTKFMHFIGQFASVLMLTWLFLNVTSNWSLLVYSLLLAVGIWQYVRKYVKSIRAFEKQLVMDQQQYYSLQSLIFMMSRELSSMAPVHTKRKRPRFFYKRQIVASPVTDLLFKTMLRHKKYRMGYLQILGLQLSIYIFAVWWVDLLVFILVYFILQSWLKSVIRHIQQEAIFTIIQVSEQQWLTATNQFKRYLIDVVMLAIGVILVLVNLL